MKGQPVTVADVLNLTRRGWRILVIAVLAGLLLATGWFAMAPRVYEARASGFIAAGGGQAVSASDSGIVRAKSYLPLITSGPVRQRIQSDPEANPGGEALDGRLSATLANGSTMIVVTATASSPEDALALANGALNALADLIGELEEQATGSGATSLTVVPLENAQLPTRPSSPNWKLILPAGAGLGLIAGYLVIFIRKLTDIRIRAGEDAAQLLDTGVLGWVPKLPGRTKETRGVGPDDVLALEAVRQIRTGLRFASVDRQVRSFVVTSANQGEGKSTVTGALAQAFAASGQATVVIDADLRRPALSKLLGAAHEVGLSEVLSGQIPAREALRSTDTDRLWVLPSGHRPPNPAEMMGSKAFQSLVTELARDHLVIIDAPPVLPVTDGALASTAVDGVVFIAAAGKTRRPELTAAKQILDRVRVPLLGLILNMTTASNSDGYHYQYSNKYYTDQAAPPMGEAVVLEQAVTTVETDQTHGSPASPPSPLSPVELAPEPTFEPSPSQANPPQASPASAPRRAVR